MRQLSTRARNQPNRHTGNAIPSCEPLNENPNVEFRFTLFQCSSRPLSRLCPLEITSLVFGDFSEIASRETHLVLCHRDRRLRVGPIPHPSFDELQPLFFLILYQLLSITPEELSVSNTVRTRERGGGERVPPYVAESFPSHVPIPSRTTSRK